MCRRAFAVAQRTPDVRPDLLRWGQHLDDHQTDVHADGVRNNLWAWQSLRYLGSRLDLEQSHERELPHSRFAKISLSQSIR
jgi:hypothetical protein